MYNYHRLQSLKSLKQAKIVTENVCRIILNL